MLRRGRITGVPGGRLSGAMVAATAGEREKHFYPQSARRLGGRGDGRVMRVGDRLHDGKAETGPVCLAASVRGEPLERLEEAVEVGCRDDWAGVGDDQDGVAGLGSRGYVHPPAGSVVADGVIDQIAHEPLDQARVTADGCRADLGLNLDSRAPDVQLGAEQDAVDDA